MFTSKFCHFEEGEQVPHDYGDIYFEQPCGDATRIVIGPSSDYVDLLIEMSAELIGQPWFVLYVLLVPLAPAIAPRAVTNPRRSRPTPGLSAFLSAFRGFFESDGRHHLWVGSASNDGVLVYDQHNVIFAYGPLDQFRSILQARGFREAEFWFPSPHAHSFQPENDSEEERLMSESEWRYFPLQPGDEWD